MMSLVIEDDVNIGHHLQIVCTLANRSLETSPIEIVNVHSIAAFTHFSFSSLLIVYIFTST